MKCRAPHLRTAIGTATGFVMFGAVIAPPVGAAAPPATTVCGGFPTDVSVIVAGNGQIGIEGAAATPLDRSIPAAASHLVRGPDGTTWAAVESGPGLTDITRTNPGGSPAVAARGAVNLSSTGWIGNRSAAVILDYRDTPRPDEPDSYGAVLIDYAGGEQVDVAAAGGPEYGINSMTIGPDRLVEGAWADLGEYVGYRAFTGARLGDSAFSPTANAAYNAPPLYVWPVTALGSARADGTTSQVLSWVEGPDWEGATNVVTGGWSLVVADLFTGTESVRVDLGNPGVSLSYADFDGRYWVGTFADASGDPDAPEPVMTPARVLIVDTAAPAPAVVDAGCPVGATASLDRLGQSPSPVAPAVAPTTTVTPPSPSTAAPAPPATAGPTCTDYTAAPDRYPIRLCQTGWAVTIIQVLLSEAGYSVDIDGYFGPGTLRAVRQFQTDRGLEVDGLVGPNTWAALFGTPDFDPALDTNGNGTLDPWEIPQGE
ncbi:hypothetical protein BH24ACT5_BH24ACT5_29330 [soil metagenome]